MEKERRGRLQVNGWTLLILSGQPQEAHPASPTTFSCELFAFALLHSKSTLKKKTLLSKTTTHKMSEGELK